MDSQIRVSTKGQPASYTKRQSDIATSAKAGQDKSLEALAKALRLVTGKRRGA